LEDEEFEQASHCDAAVSYWQFSPQPKFKVSTGRFEFTFTPKHGSWLNLIEGFFSKFARSVLR
jgi:hypothetical protein